MKFNGCEVTKEELEYVISISKTYKDITRYYGIIQGGDSYSRIKSQIKKFNIDISHFNKNYVGSSREISLEKCMVENSTLSTWSIKSKLFKYKLKEHKCEKCGQGEIWQGDKISLHLDHINGVSNDNRIENLRILCPNCHAATPNYCGRNSLIHKETLKRKEIKLKRKKNILEAKKASILNLNIDFTKKGWGVKLGKELGFSAQYSMKWVQKYMPDFYKNCFKHK